MFQQSTQWQLDDRFASSIRRAFHLYTQNFFFHKNKFKHNKIKQNLVTASIVCIQCNFALEILPWRHHNRNHNVMTVKRMNFLLTDSKSVIIDGAKVKSSEENLQY